jgi:hypothetical protein
MVTDSAFWRRLRGDFEGLQPAQFTLTWSSHLPRNFFKRERLQSQWTWWRFPDESLRARLCAIALRGAKALGYESEDAWFDRLREADFVKLKLAGHSLETQPDGSMLELRDGSIDDVVKQSITLCHVLEADCVESLPKGSFQRVRDDLRQLLPNLLPASGSPKLTESTGAESTSADLAHSASEIATNGSVTGAALKLPVEASERAVQGGFEKTDQSSATEPSGDEPTNTEAGPAMNDANNGRDRRKAVDAYIEEVFRRTGKRINRTDIWKSVHYKSRAEFERWESRWYEKSGKKPNATANRLFTNLLTEKPPLK